MIYPTHFPERRVVRFLSGLFIAANLFWSSSSAARDIVIGSIAKDIAEEIAVFQPLADYLGARLGDFGIDRGRVVVTENMPEMADLIRKQKVDIYIDSPFPSLWVSARAHTRLQLRRWKGGRAEYRSVILVHRDSDIAGLSELKGKSIAFEDAYSTSGYLLPKAAFVHSGLDPVQIRDMSGPVRPGRVGYIFSYEMENTLALLLRKRITAAGIGSHEFDSLRPWEREQVRVIHRTWAVPRHVVSIRASLDQRLADRISAILKDMENSGEGRQVLNHFEQTTRFDDIPADARTTLEELRPLVMEELAKEIGPR